MLHLRLLPKLATSPSKKNGNIIYHKALGTKRF